MKVYEEQSGDKVSENIKLAILDGELVRHLNLQSSRLTTYDLARKEAINYLRAQADVDGAWRFGSHGKVTSQWNRRSASTAGKPGHNKNECRNFSAALREKSLQPDKAGRYADPETGRRNLLEEKGYAQ